MLGENIHSSASESDQTSLRTKQPCGRQFQMRQKGYSCREGEIAWSNQLLFNCSPVWILGRLAFPVFWGPKQPYEKAKRRRRAHTGHRPASSDPCLARLSGNGNYRQGHKVLIALVIMSLRLDWSGRSGRDLQSLGQISTDWGSVSTFFSFSI